MIDSVPELVRYIRSDGRSRGADSWLKELLLDSMARFHVALRLNEYLLNTGRSSLWRALPALYYRRLSERLGLSVPLNVFEEGLAIVHHGLVVVNPAARVGKNCRVHAGVNIGGQAGFESGEEARRLAPIVGHNCYLGPGAKIFGPIVVGDGCVVGANAVVNTSFPEAEVTIAGVPARMVSRKGSAGKVRDGAKLAVEHAELDRHGGDDDSTVMRLIMMSGFGRADGGRETWAYSFLPGLLAELPDLELEILGLDYGQDHTDGLMKAIAADDRVRAKMLPSRWPRLPRFCSMYRELWSYNREQRRPVDIALAVGGLFELAMLLMPCRKPAPMRIVWLRGIFAQEKSDRIPNALMPIVRRIEASLLRRADLVLANGDDIAAHYGSPGLEIHVIRNGVDTDRWASGEPALGRPMRVGFVGRLSRVKGIEHFLDLVELASESTDLEFHVAGHGPAEERVRSLADGGHVVYHGNLDHEALPKLVADLDICVALTLSSAEGLGGGGTSNALLEQMAASRVIVAWDNDIFRQVLDHDNAFLVPQGSVASLHSVLQSIRRSPAAARRRGQRAADDVSQFSLEAQLAKFRQLAAV